MKRAGLRYQIAQATSYFLSLTSQRHLHPFSPRRRWREVKATGYYSKQKYSSSSDDYSKTKLDRFFYSTFLLGIKSPSPVENKLKSGTYTRFRKSQLCLSLEKCSWNDCKLLRVRQTASKAIWSLILST